MNSQNMQAFNRPREIYSVLGNLCADPQKLRDPEVVLTEKDFPQEFHKIIFGVIYNVAYTNADTTKINEIDIDNYLASYSQHYKIWEKHNGLEYVREAINHANSKTFRSSYERLKKFSLLRHYVDNGFDVTDLYNYSSGDLAILDEGMKTIDKMTVQEIIEHYSLKMMQVRDEFNVGQESRDFKAGDGLDNLLEDLHKDPEYGYPFANGIYNAVFRGMRYTKFMLRSAGTGAGKTRQALSDVVFTAVDKIYDIHSDKWVDNGQQLPALFISTELEKQEVQTIMLAIVSGINEQVIKDGHYSVEVHKRLQVAIEVLKKSPIYCVYVDDFSIADIETIIERHIIEFGIKIVSFDYIQLTPKLSRTMQNAFGSHLREDQILVQFSANLKILANKYNVFVESSTQLNRNSKDHDMRDTTSLRGGSATADKVDHGIMTFKIGKKELDNLKHILEQGFAGNKPNYAHYVYKNRSGRSDIIIWSYMDLGNMREIPLFVTDYDYNLVEDIQPIEIKFKDEKDDIVF